MSLLHRSDKISCFRDKASEMVAKNETSPFKKAPVSIKLQTGPVHPLLDF